MGGDGGIPLDQVIVVLVAVVAAVGAVIASRVRDRNNPMSQTVTAALATTEVVQSLLAPMQSEIAELRGEVSVLKVAAIDMRAENTLLRERVAVLEEQIRSLGHEPLPDYDPRRTK